MANARSANQAFITRIGFFSLYFIKVLTLVIIGLLAAGGIMAAYADSYGPRGESYSVLFDGANRNGTLQVYCTGAARQNSSTTFIFTSLAHGIADMSDVQNYMDLNGYTIPRGYRATDAWIEYKVHNWKSKVWVSLYQGFQHMQATLDAQDPLIAPAPLPTTIPVLGVYCNMTATCRSTNSTSAYCQKTRYYEDRKLSCLVPLVLMLPLP